MKYVIFFSIISVIVIYIFIFGLRNDPKLVPSNLINEVVPNFELVKINEKNINFFGREDIISKNEIKIINFFASWCLPCKIEHPQLKAMSKKNLLFGVNKKDRKDDLIAWLEEMGDPFEAIGADPTGQESIKWGVYGIPETFILDKDSKIRYRHVGPIMAKDLVKLNNILEKLDVEK